eukprot:225917_1
MPVLPVSRFWRNSFSKYYKLRWAIEQDLISDRKMTFDNHTFNPFWIKFNMTFLITVALFINFGVLLIPLSTDGEQLNPNLYVTYQSIYTILSYPCTVQIFEVALPNTLTSNTYRYVLLPIPVYLLIITLYIVYSPVVPGISVSKGNEYTRTLGPFILSVYAIMVFSIIVSVKYCCRNCPNIADKPLMDSIEKECDTMLTSIQFSKSPDNTAYRSTINSALLYKNSDLSDDSACADKTHVFVFNEGLQVVLAALSTAGISATYFWTQYLTWQWGRNLIVHPAAQSEYHQLTLTERLQAILLLYPVFWIGINVIKFVVSRFARYGDSNKTSRYSLELIVTFFLTCFYYVFYRNLFLHITSYTSFLLIKASHMILELSMYLLRMSPVYFEKTDALQNKLKDGRICCNTCGGLLQPLVLIMYDPAPYHIWCVRVSIDYSMQFIVSIGSGIGYIVGVVWLKYGYNQQFYDIKNIPKEQFDKALVFTALGVVVEFVAYVGIDYIMKYMYQIHVIKHWNALMRHRRGYIWYFIFILQHVLTDVMIAKLLQD